MYHCIRIDCVTWSLCDSSASCLTLVSKSESHKIRGLCIPHRCSMTWMQVEKSMSQKQTAKERKLIYRNIFYLYITTDFINVCTVSVHWWLPVSALALRPCQSLLYCLYSLMATSKCSSLAPMSIYLSYCLRSPTATCKCSSLGPMSISLVLSFHIQIHFLLYSVMVTTNFDLI